MNADLYPRPHDDATLDPTTPEGRRSIARRLIDAGLRFVGRWLGRQIGRL